MWRATVRYGQMRELGAFSSSFELRKWDRCIICSHRGVEVGTVLTSSKQAEQESSQGPQEPTEGQVLRLVTPEDWNVIRNIEQVIQKEEYRYCRKRIQQMGLPIKLITVDHLFAGEKIVFYFLADGRVDFRELVRDLARRYRTRIVMKQIGVRDEAKIMGGIERCGRALCCHTYIQAFKPITMKMAKNQLSTLDPGKISGRCGRLKCCLRYEDELYTEMRQGMPRKGAKVRTSDGPGQVAGVNIIEQKVTVELHSGKRKAYPATMILPLEEEKPEFKVRSFYVTTPALSFSERFGIEEAYVTIAADVMARLHRLADSQVLFCLFSLGQTPGGQGVFLPQLKRLAISHDIHFTTADANHQNTVREFFMKMEAQEDVYFGHYRGHFCPRCYSFLSAPRNVGEFCPYCGQWLLAIDEDGYFFRLSRYQKLLLKHVETRYDFIKPALWRLELVRRIRQGLEDILVTRVMSSQQGLPYPGNPTFAIQPWFESLICYLSVLIDDQKNLRFRTFWPANLHLASRDHLWLHGVIWPAILIAGEISLPYQVFFHGGWSLNEQQIQLDSVLNEYGCDPLRYYLLREVPFGISGEFSLPRLVQRHETELQGVMERLVHRVMGLLRHYQHRIPYPVWDCAPAREIEAMITELSAHMNPNIEALQFSVALDRIWETMERLHAYLDLNQPTADHKIKDRTTQATITYGMAEALRILALYIWQFLPQSGERILRYLGYHPNQKELLQEKSWGRLRPGSHIQPDPD